MTQNQILSVLIDHREPLWMQRLQFDDASTVVTQLQCGDAWIAAADDCLLIIERKTADDLLASIADGRLFDQAGDMVAMSPWSYVVVEGVLAPAADGKTLADGRVTNWRWASVQGALQTIQEMGVAVVYLPDSPAEFQRYLERLAKRERGTVRVGGVRKAELLAPGMSLLMSLPGVGPDRAKTLLEQAGTAAFALSVLSDDAIAVPGVGDGVRSRVREALGLTANMKLDVITI